MPNPRLRRPATVDDLAAVHAIYMHPEVVPYLGIDPATRYPGRAQHVATLQTLAVDPAVKGTGLAAAMVGEAIECLRAEGILRVELLVEADNPRGVAFYRKLGFEIEGCLKKAYKRESDTGFVDELLMAKWLGD